MFTQIPAEVIRINFAQALSVNDMINLRQCDNRFRAIFTIDLIMSRITDDVLIEAYANTNMKLITFYFNNVAIRDYFGILRVAIEYFYKNRTNDDILMLLIEHGCKYAKNKLPSSTRIFYNLILNSYLLEACDVNRLEIVPNLMKIILDYGIVSSDGMRANIQTMLETNTYLCNFYFEQDLNGGFNDANFEFLCEILKHMSVYNNPKNALFVADMILKVGKSEHACDFNKACRFKDSLQYLLAYSMTVMTNSQQESDPDINALYNILAAMQN